MSTLIDSVDDEKPTTAKPQPDAETKTLDDVIQPIAEPKQENSPAKDTTQPKQDELPEKYQGKSLKELAEMHQNAERLLGRQSSEVGDLRKIVDDFIQTQHASQSTTTNKDDEVDEIDFLDDPKAAINAAIENHPAVKKAKETSLTVEQQRASNALQKRHPDMEDIFADQDFIKWVGDSPYRVRTLRQANDNFDVEAADEIFSTWKELKQHSAQTTQTQDTQQQIIKDDQQRAVSNAKTGATTGGGGEVKKIYRRSDIRKLMIEDRPRYEALQDELSAAYREGRVR